MSESAAELRARYEAQVRGSIPRPQTVSELAMAWLSHCKETYPRREGKRSSTYTNARDAVTGIVALYGSASIAEAGNSVALQSVRLWMIDQGLSRRTINDRIARIRRMYRWARDRGWVTQEVVDALCIDGLRRNRPAAGGRTVKETPKKRAAPIESIVRVLRDSRMSPVVKAMIRTQFRTGMRPAEVVELRGIEIDTSESEWVYEPEDWKMAYLEERRVVLIGARAQLAILPHLNNGYIFRSRLGKPYRIDSYRQEIHRACERQGVPRFGPQQIRKRTITEAAKYGENVAQKIAGHTDVRTTRKHYIDARHSPEALAFAKVFG